MYKLLLCFRPNFIYVAFYYIYFWTSTDILIYTNSNFAKKLVGCKTLHTRPISCQMSSVCAGLILRNYKPAYQIYSHSESLAFSRSANVLHFSPLQTNTIFCFVAFISIFLSLKKYPKCCSYVVFHSFQYLCILDFSL